MKEQYDVSFGIPVANVHCEKVIAQTQQCVTQVNRVAEVDYTSAFSSLVGYRFAATDFPRFLVHKPP